MMPLHLIKLAAGARGLDDLRGWQASRLVADPPLRHRTRNFPRRAAELLDGGSIYWVISQVVSVRQRLLDVVEAQREDGTACTDLVLDPVLVQVQGGRCGRFRAGVTWPTPTRRPISAPCRPPKPRCRSGCGVSWPCFACYKPVIVLYPARELV